MSFLRNVRDIKRISQVANVLARHGLGYLIAEIGLKYHLDFVKQFTSFKEPASISLRLRKSMEELGGTYIKLGQLLSLRPDLVPAEYCQEFQKLQDKANPMPWRTVKTIIEKELRKPIKEVFQTFDEEPIGSASIGQVHRASLKNNKMVVVKVMRPKIKQQFEADLDILHHLAAQIEKRYSHIPARMIIDEFERYTKRELDFNIEADNVNKFYNNFIDSDTIRIPKPYDELSTERVLVLEYIDGKKLTHITAPAKRKKLAHNLIDLTARQVLEMDIFHADLHPGNIFALKDGRIALLDFGIVGSLTPRLRKLGIQLMAGLVQKDSDLVYRSLVKVGTSSPKTSFESLKREVHDIVQQWQSGMSTVKITTTLHVLFNACQHHKLKIPADIVLLAKALVTAEGTALHLDPKIDFREEVAPRIEKLLNLHARKQMNLKGAAKAAIKTTEILHDGATELIDLLRKLKHGSISVDVEDEDMNRLSISIDRSSNRLSYGMIIAALLISGTLMRDIPFTYNNIPIIPIMFFSAAGIMGITLAVSISKEGKEKLYKTHIEVNR